MNNNRTFHFLLVGVTTSRNKGCEALVYSAVTILREQFPEAKITIAALFPEDEGALANNIPNLEVVPGFNRNSSLIGRYPISYTVAKLIQNISPYIISALHDKGMGFKAMLPQSRPKSEAEFSRVRHLRRVMLEADAVILLCGDIYNLDFCSTPIYFMEVMEYAQLLKRKTIIWSASIWNYNVRWFEKRLKDILQKADLITARDESTIQYLLGLGISRNVVLAADSAFLLEPKETSRTNLPFYPKPQLTVGFNGSDLIYYYLSKNRYKKFISDITQFIQFLIDAFRCCIVFIPHDGYPIAQEREFLYEIKLMLGRKNSIYMIPVGLEASEVKAVIGKCNIFIGMRFHSTVASLSQCIPTLGMYYSLKFVGLHKSVFGHTDYLIHYKEASFDSLMQKFRKILNEKSEIQELLTKRIPDLQKQASLAGIYLRNLFK